MIRALISVALAAAIAATPGAAVAQTSSLASGGSLGSSTGSTVVPDLPVTPEPPRIDFTFKRGNYAAAELPESAEPYYHPSFQRDLEPATADSEGISVRVVDGVEVNHPVSQAQYMLTRLNTYRINQDPRFLERVEKTAGRLMSYGVEVAEATFLPYPFDFSVHGRDSLEAPWYSGMAQGQALSAFTRLYEVTGNQTYRAFANRLFESFLLHKGEVSTPWVTQVDDAGYLWFEEYARENYADFTYNGHMYAVIGLYDYYQLTNDRTVLEMYQGGATTVLDYADEFRNPGDVSSYCLTHPDVKSKSYHEVHIRELRLFTRLTGDPEFDRYADLYRQDYDPATA